MEWRDWRWPADPAAGTGALPAYAAVMGGIFGGRWVEIAAFENAPGGIRPPEFLAGWLRERGIDWLPFASIAVRIDLSCGKVAGNRWQGWYSVKISATALRRLGLHPDQAPEHFLGTEHKNPASADQPRSAITARPGPATQMLRTRCRTGGSGAGPFPGCSSRTVAS